MAKILEFLPALKINHLSKLLKLHNDFLSLSLMRSCFSSEEQDYLIELHEATEQMLKLVKEAK